MVKLLMLNVLLLEIKHLHLPNRNQKKYLLVDYHFNVPKKSLLTTLTNSEM